MPSPGMGVRPSTITRPGFTERRVTLRFIAHRVAARMLSLSIRRCEAAWARQATPIRHISAKIATLEAADRAFESLKPIDNRRTASSLPRTTAAATTGPARGPRPASSTPATITAPPPRAAGRPVPRG